MLFTLEALEAKHGDALLLHFGTRKAPQLAVIDGGPAGVYAKSLKPRLDDLKKTRSPVGALPIRMVMVSHIDDDHINGVLQLMKTIADLQSSKRDVPYEITSLWHNSLDGLLGNEADELMAALQPAVVAASSGTFSSRCLLRYDTSLILASVNQARELTSLANALGASVNEGFGTLVMVPKEEKCRSCRLDSKLSFTVIGPHEEQVRKLQDEWKRQVKKQGVALAAAFADDSVFNLSSIVVLAKAGSKTMLLTGDARGDHIVQALTRAGLMEHGVCHVDLLKIPHHGSDRNVSTQFFRQVTADHYVVSGNGEYGNPEVATLQMLSQARGNDEFTIHLTNGKLTKDPKPRKLLDFFKSQREAGKKYEVVFRDEVALSVQVDLGDEVLEETAVVRSRKKR
jgi:hypothetical protein